MQAKLLGWRSAKPAQAVESRLLGIADHKEPQTVVCHVSTLKESRTSAPLRAERAAKRARILQDQDGDFVLAHSDDNLRRGLLVQIDKAAAQQRELGSGKFRKVEREGNAALEPGFYGVPV